MGNKDYYKGNRQGSLPGGPITGPPGRYTRRGKYILDDRKVRVFVCPPPQVLNESKLRAFVTREAVLSEQQERKDLGAWKALKGKNYLRLLGPELREEAREHARQMPPIPEP
ncbi:hypothetical protein PIIN_11685 [Serendipita indica DSM 11827]|uniref:Uncharacterized protein n=1 Tax=Serendipita indica (strain DSM 11827) TaxID=1109443 RepID=G4TDZ1_SERID|nr:hypothetical protein PIIN_11685 [Serendipita indica DSM 11827]